MKKLIYILIITMLISLSPVYGGVADDFQNLGNSYKKLKNNQNAGSTLQERILNIKETAIFHKLVNTRKALSTIINNTNSIEISLLKRFRDRLQFEVSHENRKDLKPFLEKLSTKLQANFTEPERKKRIAYIYGNEVNLLNGEWQNTPDGHRFWISAEYPDIVLSPADFRKYVEGSTTVFE